MTTTMLPPTMADDSQSDSDDNLSTSAHAPCSLGLESSEQCPPTALQSERTSQFWLWLAHGFSEISVEADNARRPVESATEEAYYLKRSTFRKTAMKKQKRCRNLRSPSCRKSLEMQIDPLAKSLAKVPLVDHRWGSRTAPKTHGQTPKTETPKSRPTQTRPTALDAPPVPGRRIESPRKRKQPVKFPMTTARSALQNPPVSVAQQLRADMASSVSNSGGYMQSMPNLDTASLIQHVLGELSLLGDDDKTDASPNGVDQFPSPSGDASVATENAVADDSKTLYSI